MRHIGVLAHSVPGAALCFQAIGDYGQRKLGEHQHPETSLDCIPMGRSMPAWHAGDHAAIREILAESVERLAKAGADFFICPDNTAHLALEHPGPPLALPGVHIVDVVARHAADAGYRTVGVLGTRWTMEADLYPRALASYGLSSKVPPTRDREVIQAITFDELVNGVFTDAARDRFTAVIGDLAEAGCDAVALVCTEFPLLVRPDASPLPTLESTVLLAHAAVDVATGTGEPPRWTRGPIAD